MPDQDADPVRRLTQERSFPTNHPSGGLSEDNLEWLSAQDESVDQIIRMERIRREHPEAWSTLSSACQDQNRRPVIAALLHNGGKATYDDLMQYTSCTRRTVRNHVYALRDEDVVEVGDGCPRLVRFHSEAVELLASDCLSIFYSSE